MIAIEEHKLKDAEGKVKISFQETPNVSGPFSSGLPDTIVIHYTAGSSAASSASWLQNPKAKASAHLVVGKKGEIIQLAPFDIRTWHAGRSSWKGRSGLNQYSIGIEIDNAGVLTQTAEGYMTNFSKLVSNKNVVLAAHKLDSNQRGWEAYTAEQIEAVEEICLALVETYNITEIVGHDDIAPSRKRDPGPAFPMESLRNRVLFGRDEDLPDEPDDTLDELAIVSADNLNIRTSPGTGSSLVSNPLPRGTKVKITKTQGGWSYVKTDIEGWVSNQWLRTV
ncbi:N-acetylmuramoyl-L-alanine amidase [Maribellus mangrovi]|uniref:N-acetylmuramoyl-L-alanine amidase n=1 Tax=Maribellus mangrovi TaxID=3133146 RepID=UPI0030ED2201